MHTFPVPRWSCPIVLVQCGVCGSSILASCPDRAAVSAPLLFAFVQCEVLSSIVLVGEPIVKHCLKTAWLDSRLSTSLLTTFGMHQIGCSEQQKNGCLDLLSVLFSHCDSIESHYHRHDCQSKQSDVVECLLATVNCCTCQGKCH